MLSEEQFHSLRKHGIGIANSILKNIDDSEDIVQTNLVKLFEKYDTIEKPENWFYTVVKNASISKLNEYKKNKEVEYNDEIKYIDSIQYTDAQINDEIANEVLNIDLAKAKQLLTRDDFVVYRRYMKCDQNLQKYIYSARVSKALAKRHIHKMKRNLRSSLLVKSDLVLGIDLLNYNQIQNISYFMKKLTNSSSEKEISKRLKNISLPESFSITKLLEYNILKRENNYHIILVGLKNKEYNFEVAIYILTIKFKRNTFDILKIIDSKKEAEVITDSGKKNIDLESPKRRGISIALFQK